MFHSQLAARIDNFDTPYDQWQLHGIVVAIFHEGEAKFQQQKTEN